MFLKQTMFLGYMHGVAAVLYLQSVLHVMLFPMLNMFCTFTSVFPQCAAVVYPGILFGGVVQQIQLRTEDRENRDLGAVAP